MEKETKIKECNKNNKSLLYGAGIVLTGVAAYTLGYKISTKQVNVGLKIVFKRNPELGEKFVDELLKIQKEKMLKGCK